MLFQKKYLLLYAIAILLFATGCPKPKEDACGPVRVKCVDQQGALVNGILVKGAYLSVQYDGQYYSVQDTMYTGSSGRPEGCADVFACKGETVSTKSTPEYKAATADVATLDETITITLQKR